VLKITKSTMSNSKTPRRAAGAEISFINQANIHASSRCVKRNGSSIDTSSNDQHIWFTKVFGNLFDSFAQMNLQTPACNRPDLFKAEASNQRFKPCYWLTSRKERICNGTKGSNRKLLAIKASQS